MKITKSYLKQVIKESLNNYHGLFSKQVSELSDEELANASYIAYKSLVKKIIEQYPDDLDLHNYLYDKDWSMDLARKELLKRLSKNENF